MGMDDRDIDLMPGAPGKRTLKELRRRHSSLLFVSYVANSVEEVKQVWA